MGYGLIKVSKNTVSLIEMGVLQLAKKDNHAERLAAIFRKMDALIALHQPMAIAIESPFFGKNVQSMLKLGRAQGVAIAAAMLHGLEAVEYAPRKIKQAICGRGNASKEQVWQMLQANLRFQEKVEFMDATDALAVALCHHYELRAVSLGLVVEQPTRKSAKKSSGWADFAQKHPNRIK